MFNLVSINLSLLFFFVHIFLVSGAPFSFVRITMTWQERAYAGYSLHLSGFQVLKWIPPEQEICFRWWWLSSSRCTIWTGRMNKSRRRCGVMTTQTNCELRSALFYQAKTQSFTQLNKWKTTARIFFFYLPGNPLYTACLHPSWPRKIKTELADLKSFH